MDDRLRPRPSPRFGSKVFLIRTTAHPEGERYVLWMDLAWMGEDYVGLVREQAHDPSIRTVAEPVLGLYSDAPVMWGKMSPLEAAGIRVMDGEEKAVLDEWLSDRWQLVLEQDYKT